MRRFAESRLLIATHNAGKFEEFQALFAPLGISLCSAAELSLEAPAETESSFVGNARLKARSAAQASGLVCLADDSGIAVDALGGMPGIYTADWAETLSGRDFGLAMQKTWDLAGQSGAKPPYRAQFRCALALAWPDGYDEMFEGSVAGTLVWPQRGREGHGYDPMFKPDGHTKTFAEMGPALKNSISHRSAALKQLIEGCFT